MAKISHLSTINADLVKTDQSCLRVLSPSLPANYKLEITIPMGGGAAPKIITQMNRQTTHITTGRPRRQLGRAVGSAQLPSTLCSHPPVGHRFCMAATGTAVKNEGCASRRATGDNWYVGW